MQSLDGLLSIYITGEYTKKHIETIQENLRNIRIAKFNRKLSQPELVVKHVIDSILEADIVIAVTPEDWRILQDEYASCDFEIGYAKALNKRVLMVTHSPNTDNTDLMGYYNLGYFAADYNANNWNDALSILISFTDLATQTV